MRALFAATLALAGCSAADATPQTAPAPAGPTIWHMDWHRDGRFNPEPRCIPHVLDVIGTAERTAAEFPGGRHTVMVLPAPNGSGTTIMRKLEFGDGGPPVIFVGTTTEAACLAQYRSAYEAFSGAPGTAGAR